MMTMMIFIYLFTTNKPDDMLHLSLQIVMIGNVFLFIYL